MSEVEFERLLEAVRTAVAPVPGEDFATVRPVKPMIMFAAPPLEAANDDQMAWPLIPFPDGWCASY